MHVSDFESTKLAAEQISLGINNFLDKDLRKSFVWNYWLNSREFYSISTCFSLSCYYVHFIFEISTDTGTPESPKNITQYLQKYFLWLLQIEKNLIVLGYDNDHHQGVPIA